MPSLFRARRLVAVPLVALAAIALAGCDRPTPSITLQSGGTSVSASATQYQRAGATITHTPNIPQIKVVPGGAVGIDVSRSVADQGYYLSVGGQRISDTVKTSHYRLEVGTSTGTAQLIIFQAPRSGQKSASGSWVFNLKVAP